MHTLEYIIPNSTERQENFPSDQCQKVEKIKTIGKARDLFKEMRDTKGILREKMGTIKDRNSMDLTEAEGITSGLF